MILRVGIIGAARVATYAMIAPARALPDVEVVAVAARDPDRARAYAAAHGIARVHDDYAALVADPAVDLVYVATPPKFHLEQARLAIAAGKALLVEKPFTMDAGEAALLLGEAAAAGVPVFEAMHSRHHAIWALIADLLPCLGRIRHVEAVFDARVSTAAAEFRWQAGLGGGALMDLGVYPLAWVRAIAGEPLAVTAAQFRHERGADAAFSADLLLADGVTAHVASDMAGPVKAQMTVTGSLGTLSIDNPLAPQRGHALVLTTAAGAQSFSAPGPGSYDAQLAAVAATLLDGAVFPLAADDPLWSMRAIDAVRAAAANPEPASPWAVTA
jgi:predicted dehydrogenase